MLIPCCCWSNFQSTFDTKVKLFIYTQRTATLLHLYLRAKEWAALAPIQWEKKTLPQGVKRSGGTANHHYYGAASLELHLCLPTSPTLVYCLNNWVKETFTSTSDNWNRDSLLLPAITLSLFQLESHLRMVSLVGTKVFRNLLLFILWTH
jgi:hypothetical protein